jgi:hypothetical protein
MNLDNLKQVFSDNGCKRIYVKELSPNDNSKNQVYLGGSFDILNVFPISDVSSDDSGDWKRVRFKASVDFSWITPEGEVSKAPHTQLILYPKYPEVRLSGFLARCEHAPSELMASRIAGRIMFLAATDKGTLLCHVCSSESDVARSFKSMLDLEKHGVFSIINLGVFENARNILINELARIHSYEWIKSKRLGKDGSILPCNAPNCGGYTLEAEFGITPNGYSEPDFMGWELKQFAVSRFDRIGSSVITLFTPEPTGGYYTEHGVESFVRKYGYEDRMGRLDRMNFGGIHKSGIVHPLTGLKLTLLGFEIETGKIRSSDGCIALIDKDGVITASWSFTSLLKHWNRKHNQACYVPSQKRILPILEYRYGNLIMLNTGTDFILFLKAMSKGEIYYDPGIKLENASGRSLIKRRSQFRIKSQHLPMLYNECDMVDLLHVN